MERLLKDAEKIKRANGEMVTYSIDSFADMVDAIHVVQTEMGITGTTADEADKTISGSISSMKAAWSNLVTGIANDNADFEGLMGDFVSSVETVGKNVLPRVKEALKGAAKLVSELAPTIAEELPGLMEDILPELAAATADLIIALAEQIPGMVSALIDAARTVVDEIGEAFAERIPGLSFVFENLEVVIAAVVAGFVALKTAMAISAIIDGVTKAFQAYKVANEGATVAQWLLNAAMNANPIMLIITLIAALVAGIIALWNTNDDFKNGLINAWEGVKNTAEKVWNGIAGFFTETIPNAFKSLLDGAKTWGKDMIDNFIGGIKEKWDKLKDIVSNVAQSVKDFLGFSEPKKGPLSNFHTYAPDMMDLFAKGIRDNEKVVTAQIAKSFDFGEQTIGFGAEYAGAAGRYSGGGTSFGNITINIDGAKYNNEESLAEAIAEKIQIMADRGAAVYA